MYNFSAFGMRRTFYLRFLVLFLCSENIKSTSLYIYNIYTHWAVTIYTIAQISFCHIARTHNSTHVHVRTDSRGRWHNINICDGKIRRKMMVEKYLKHARFFDCFEMSVCQIHWLRKMSTSMWNIQWLLSENLRGRRCRWSVWSTFFHLSMCCSLLAQYRNVVWHLTRVRFKIWLE